MTDFEAKVLRLLNDKTHDLSAGWIAGEVWRDRPRQQLWSRQGRNQRMGAILRKLQGKGWVHNVYTDYHKNMWSISNKGKQELQKHEINSHSH